MNSIGVWVCASCAVAEWGKQSKKLCDYSKPFSVRDLFGECMKSWGTVQKPFSVPLIERGTGIPQFHLGPVRPDESMRVYMPECGLLPGTLTILAWWWKQLRNILPPLNSNGFCSPYSHILCASFGTNSCTFTKAPSPASNTAMSLSPSKWAMKRSRDWQPSGAAWSTPRLRTMAGSWTDGTWLAPRYSTVLYFTEQ